MADQHNITKPSLSLAHVDEAAGLSFPRSPTVRVRQFSQIAAKHIDKEAKQNTMPFHRSETLEVRPRSYFSPRPSYSVHIYEHFERSYSTDRDRYRSRCHSLEDEKSNLKEENKRLEEENKRLEEENKRLEEENKRLEEEIKSLTGNYDRLLEAKKDVLRERDDMMLQKTVLVKEKKDVVKKLKAAEEENMRILMANSLIGNRKWIPGVSISQDSD